GLDTDEATLQAPETPLVVYYSHGGQTEKVAQLLAESLSAPVYRIETTRPYNPMEAKEARQRGLLPEIKRNFPPLKNFSRIVLVFPVWGYTVCLPMQKFLSLADLQGKQVDAVAVSVGKLGGTFENLEKMLKGGTLEKTNSITFVDKRTEDQLKTMLSRWNTGAVPRKVLLCKGIQVGGVPLTEIVVDNKAFALQLPRTTTYSTSATYTPESPKPTDPAPGKIYIGPDGAVSVDGVHIGKTTSKLAKGTFTEGGYLTLY
ncbi:MAG: hypothetical protein LUC43_03275, partial [Burkholderiales bacterium]|nr:hypothetical protein [Burkholderiales bacterium]